MPNFSKGTYIPKNPQKYIGKRNPTFRSSWEMRVMMFLDENKHITHWASESISIPYRSPLDGKIHQYIPDFFVVYENKSHQIKAEIVEVKPKSQTKISY